MRDVTDLACRARDGDQDALAEFIRATITDVRRYCGSLVDSASADDLTQDTYFKAIKSLHSFRADAPAGAWLLSVARHTCIDEIRRRSRQREALTFSLIVEPPTESDIAGQITLDIAISALDTDRREAFVLTQILGLSYAEAAETVRCPIGTLRSRVFRARADLISALHEPIARGATRPPSSEM